MQSLAEQCGPGFLVCRLSLDPSPALYLSPNPAAAVGIEEEKQMQADWVLPSCPAPKRRAFGKRRSHSAPAPYEEGPCVPLWRPEDCTHHGLPSTYLPRMAATLLLLLSTWIHST